MRFNIDYYNSTCVLIYYYLNQNNVILNVFVYQWDNLNISSDNLFVNFKVEYELFLFKCIKLLDSILFFNTPDI